MERTFEYQRQQRDGEELIQFLLDAAPLYARFDEIKAYAPANPFFMRQCEDLYNEFRSRFGGIPEITAPATPQSLSHEDACASCEQQGCRVVSEHGTMVCTECGVEDRFGFQETEGTIIPNPHIAEKSLSSTNPPPTSKTSLNVFKALNALGPQPRSQQKSSTTWHPRRLLCRM